MNRINKLIDTFLLLILIVPVISSVSANDSGPGSMDASLISDLNQTIGKDALSHVDKSRLDVYNNPEFSFYWDPSGTRVLIFVLINVCTKNDTSSQATLGMVQALYIANGNGSGEKLIAWAENTPYTRKRNEHNGIAIPSWNPTGSSFLYQQSSGGNVHFIGGIHDIKVVDSKSLDLLAKKRISLDGPIYEWSPNGDKLLYLGFNEKKEPSVFILDINTNTSVEEALVKNYKTKFGNEDFIWSPDGKKILFAEDEDLFILDPVSSEVENIFSADNVHFDRTAWSPDSSKVVAYTFENEESDNQYSDIHIIDVKNKKSNRLITLNYGIVYGWSPDSNKIIFKELSKNDTGSTYTLNSMSTDGSSEIRLFNSSDDFYVSLSPTGKFIEITYSLGESNKVTDKRISEFILMAIDGSGKKHWNIFENGYVWNNKDDLVLGLENENQSNALAVINASTKEIRAIQLPVSHIEGISWSPTGRYLVARTISQKTSSDDGNSFRNYVYQDYLLELPEYDLPMHLEIDDKPVVESDVNISVRSASGGISNATIFVENKSVGITDENGTLVYRFNKEGEFHIRAAKDGYSAINWIIVVKNHSEKQKINGEVIPETVNSSHVHDTELPGFTTCITFFELIFALFCVLKMNKK